MIMKAKTFAIGLIVLQLAVAALGQTFTEIYRGRPLTACDLKTEGGLVEVLAPRIDLERPPHERECTSAITSRVKQIGRAQHRVLEVVPAPLA